MAPLIYFGHTPYRSGVSTTDADRESWIDTGVFDPNAKSEKEKRKALMLKKLEKKKRQTIVSSEHRTASLRLLKTAKEEHDRLVSHPSEMDLKEKRLAASHHTHGHKMLAELILNDPTIISPNSPPPHSSSHQLKHDLSPSPLKNKRPYTPNEAVGIPTSNYQSDRWVTSVSIKPAHKKNSTVRLGFSGHAAEPKKRPELIRCSALDSPSNKRLLSTPVIVPEGILKDVRTSALFRSIGEFPHRDRVPLSEKIRVGRELSRKPDTIKTTRAGGFTWMATNEDMPYEANNVLDASYIKEELEWLKSKAFVKGDDKRPRTKGLISSQLTKMTRPTIMEFIPLANRKEYRDNILGLGQTPGGGKKKEKGEGAPAGSSPQNRGVLARFRPLDRAGDLDTIHSGDADSMTGSQSLQSLSQGLEGEGSAVLGWNGSESGGRILQAQGGAQSPERTTDQPETHHQQPNMGSTQTHHTHTHNHRHTNRRSWIVSHNRARPVTSVGLMGRRMAPIEVRHSTGTFETAERPITITDSLRANILKSRGVVVAIDL
ncbi:hypothetical protein TrST_g8914 [Triparma strigata]|uniref:Uncharacterized protein n=1 Tax=Triparma strigata TaxID=1606541 RepID=A0A9W7B0F1_9STRA|nr:hypothetical protein TrST_g8914 [Triparma strigata]